MPYAFVTLKTSCSASKKRPNFKICGVNVRTNILILRDEKHRLDCKLFYWNSIWAHSRPKKSRAFSLYQVYEEHLSARVHQRISSTIWKDSNLVRQLELFTIILGRKTNFLGRIGEFYEFRKEEKSWTDHPHRQRVPRSNLVSFRFENYPENVITTKLGYAMKWAL